MATRPLSQLWSQSLPFSCGAAALGSLLSTFGWRPARDRFAAELEIWRESNAIACPGTHPFGLALAAARRGFSAEVRLTGNRPWLWRHIRTAHPGLDLPHYRSIESALVRDCRTMRVRLRSVPPARSSLEAGLLLTHVGGNASHRDDPHWIGLVPGPDRVLVLDPLRSAPYRSERPLGAWWDASGFDGTKSWIAVGRARAAGVPSGTARRSQPHRSTSRTPGEAGVPEGPAHVHLHHHRWTRENALAWLEAPDRRSTQDPEVVWDHARLTTGETVVDLGAGTGFFALVAARRVGAVGRVYAVDTSEELVGLLRERRTQEGLPQLVPVLSTPGTIPLRSNIADALLLANVLHDVPSSTVAEAVRLLRPGGRVINVDWKKEDTPGGPPFELRLRPEDAAARFAEHGLELDGVWELGPWHYGLTLHRPETKSTRSTTRET